MNREQRLAAVRALAAKADAENREFTPAESATIREHLDIVKKSDESKRIVAELGEYLSQAPDDEDDVLGGGGGRGPAGVAGERAFKARKSNPADAWSRALAKAVPTVDGTKSFTLPAATAFAAPTPAPILNDATTAGRLYDNVNVVLLDTPTSGVSYLRQVERSRAATTVAPRALKPFKNVTLERVDSPARTIAAIIPEVPVQDVRDYRDLAVWLDRELQIDVFSELERQMLLGDGTGENFEGVFLTDGIAIEPYGTAPSATLRRSLARLEELGHSATVIALHPRDLADLELETDASGGGAYRGNRSPSLGRSLWNVPVVSTPAVPRGLAVAGDWRQARLWVREEVEVRVSDTVGESFERNTLVFRGELRAAFGVTAPQAFAVARLDPEVPLPSGE